MTVYRYARKQLVSQDHKGRVLLSEIKKVRNSPILRKKGGVKYPRRNFVSVTRGKFLKEIRTTLNQRPRSPNGICFVDMFKNWGSDGSPLTTRRPKSPLEKLYAQEQDTMYAAFKQFHRISPYGAQMLWQTFQGINLADQSLSERATVENCSKQNVHQKRKRAFKAFDEEAPHWAKALRQVLGQK